MATIKVHGYQLSTATKVVLCCLEEKQVDYELVVVDAAAGAHKQPQYLALNPFGLVPTIQDGDFTLFESRAIVKYLAKKYKGQGTELFGNSLSEEALVEQWCEVEGQSYNTPAMTIMVQILFVPKRGGTTDGAVVEMNQILFVPKRGGTTDEVVVETNVEKLVKVLDIYEERLSKSKYLAGDFFSLADLQHLPTTHYLVTACGKGDLISSRKHVKAWWEDISSRPAWKKILEKEPQ